MTNDETQPKKEQPRLEDLIVKQARAEYDTFLTGLRDQITYLGHDLNPGAVASLKPEAAKLNARAKQMFEKINAVTSTASASLDAMKAQ